ncbi:MAG: putative Ig domain-containing protein [Trueperaceae bacterium]|nr:putative Ig domain-containing protein [Trueperaceae bacterium]
MLLIAWLGACTSDLAVPTEPLRLLRTDWAVAYLGEPFDGALRPTGGLRPYRFEVADGELPPGMNLSAGRLVGTPTEVGRFAFTVQVRDGNLSQALQQVEFDVRPLPDPIVRVDAPRTELRGVVPLIVRVEDARGWRGARIALTWDAEAFALVAPPAASDARLAVLHETGDGFLHVEAAALGAARNGAFDLARFSLRPLAPPAQLSLQLTAVSRYSGGEHLVERAEGVPRPRPSPAPPAAPVGSPADEEGAAPTAPAADADETPSADEEAPPPDGNGEAAATDDADAPASDGEEDTP